MLAIIPFCAFGGNFVYHEYSEYGNEYWYDEYWDDPYWCDGRWVYYPHGYYCVHYVWWYPWWWDSYWWRCHWCHHFSWDFYRCGFYTVWYESGCWWFRPRYGRWVRYRVPYSYHEIRHYSQQHGITLPPKPPREINVPYKEQEIMNLTREKDPTLFKEIEKEHKSGNLEKMRKEYDVSVKKEITRKNLEYKKEKDISIQKSTDSKTPDKGVNDALVPYKTPEKKVVKNPYTDDSRETKKVNTPVGESPVEKKPEYKSPDQRERSNDDEYDPRVKRNDHNSNDNNDIKEKTPTPVNPGAKSKSVMKNPYTKPDNDHKTPTTQDADKKPTPNAKR